MGPPRDPAGSDTGRDLARAVRETSRRLVVLDNAPGGTPIAGPAVGAFLAVRRRLVTAGAGGRVGREVWAAAAELAEIAGWALFDAARFRAAQRFNREALRLARLAGDASMELLVLQNTGLVAGWSGRGRDELAIAEAALARRRLTPRVASMFRARQAQGLAVAGAEWEVAKAFRRAHDLLGESEPAHTPAWAWWVTHAEIDRQHGRVLHDAGRWAEAIPVLRGALGDGPENEVGYRGVVTVRLLDCYLRVGAWAEAEQTAGELLVAAPEMTSAVIRRLLRDAAAHGGRRPGVPGDLRDALRALRATASPPA
ncbi:tetratricopeptide repeat protein, partial [Streptomyces triticirhizae]|uniref:hypothetical protein n=1 Tax=Streptomyces triticirhizae TaxID=2483353 RepID=UPI0011C41D14